MNKKMTHSELVFNATFGILMFNLISIGSATLYAYLTMTDSFWFYQSKGPLRFTLPLVLLALSLPFIILLIKAKDLFINKTGFYREAISFSNKRFKRWHPQVILVITLVFFIFSSWLLLQKAIFDY